MAGDTLPRDVQEILGGRKLEDILIKVAYTNWEGKTSLRRILPIENPYRGSTPHHKEEQWLMKVWDVDKRDYRIYALKDCNFKIE